MDIIQILSTVGTLLPMAVTAAKVAEALPNQVAPVTKDQPNRQLTVAQAVSILLLAYVAYEQGNAGAINVEELVLAGTIVFGSLFALYGDLKGRIDGLFKR